MIATRSFYEVANFTFIRFNPVSANLPITCAGSSPQWSWIWLVFRSTCSHIRRWTEFVWIEWCHECAWQTIPVKKANNERDTCDKTSDRMIILIMLPFIDIIGVVVVTVTVNGDKSIQNGLWFQSNNLVFPYSFLPIAILRTYIYPRYNYRTLSCLRSFIDCWEISFSIWECTSSYPVAKVCRISDSISRRTWIHAL